MKELDEATTELLLALQAKPRMCLLRHVVLWIDGDAHKAAAWSAQHGIPVSVLTAKSPDLKNWKIDPKRPITVVLAESHRTIGTITSLGPMEVSEFDAQFLLVAARAMTAEHRYSQMWASRTLKYFKPSEEVLAEFVAGIQDEEEFDAATRSKILTALGPEALAAYRTVVELSKFQRAVNLDPYAPILVKHGIDPTADSLTSFLRDLNPNRVAPLIEQLVADDFRKRQQAMQRLVQLPRVPAGLLQAAANGRVPELAWRAKLILKQRDNTEPSRLVFAVLQTIRTKTLPIPSGVLLAAITSLEEDHLVVAARGALAATASPQDADVLRRALKSQHTQQRIAAVVALAKLLGSEAKRDIEPLLDDGSAWVRLACAISLAGMGDRQALNDLASLLSANEYRIRARSVEILRALTGKSFGYGPFDEPDRRITAVRDWKKWAAGDGQTVELRLPLKNNLLQPTVRGRFLLAIKGECELYVNGKRVLTTSGGKRRQSDEISLKAGDVIVARIRSRWVYRAIRVSFIATDRQSLVPFRRDHFRHVDSLDISAVDVAAVVRSPRKPPRPGRPDKGYQKAWSALSLDGDDSQWMWGWKKNAWHQLACVVSPTMFKSTALGAEK